MTPNMTEWLLEKLAEETGEHAESISTAQKFETMNLDSLSLLSISHEIESALNIEVDPTAMTEFDTIEKLAEWLESKM